MQIYDLHPKREGVLPKARIDEGGVSSATKEKNPSELSKTEPTLSFWESKEGHQIFGRNLIICEKKEGVNWYTLTVQQTPMEYKGYKEQKKATIPLFLKKKHWTKHESDGDWTRDLWRDRPTL